MGWFDETEYSSCAIGARLFADAAMSMYEDAIQVAKDAIRSIRKVPSFCREEKVIKIYKEKPEAPMKTGIPQGIGSGIDFVVTLVRKSVWRHEAMTLEISA
ncbi:hypothetical protein F2Q70_00003826 [Brassica cretica]|uniref:Uncharacterized protein n=1 Tax=Brassica cretica TaxID=69181 RepID=A0A8S9J254_BRACR|nr:hypothetical protein F2Q70_00003826 [Brassica cretica]